MTYGLQGYLYITHLLLLGALLSTMVWVGIMLSTGSVTKSSRIAAFGSFGVFIALNFVTPIIAAFMGNLWIRSLFPGSGASDYIAGAGTASPFLNGVSVSTGTDTIGILLTQYALYPSSLVAFYKVVAQSSTVKVKPPVEDLIKALHTAPLGSVILRSFSIAFVYIAALSLVAWYGLRSIQIAERFAGQMNEAPSPITVIHFLMRQDLTTPLTTYGSDLAKASTLSSECPRKARTEPSAGSARAPASTRSPRSNDFFRCSR